MEILDVLPLAISLVAVVLSTVFGIVTIRDRRLSTLLAREADLHAWVQQMAGIYADLRTRTGEERSEALVRLSLQIDDGRLLFPNDTTPEALKTHPKGYRSSILDPLKVTHERVARGTATDAEIASDWRQFTDQLTERTTAFQINTSPASSKAQYRIG